MEQVTIHTDGGARGNPGPAGYAFILSRPGEPDVEENGYLGEATNNVAEYTAVVKALTRARELGARRVLLKSDSELMVKQMTGLYKVKNEGLRPLFEEARRLTRDFDQVTFQHVRREQNSDADRLCNEAMDYRESTRSGAAAASAKVPVEKAAPAKSTAVKAKAKAGAADKEAEARAEAVALLNTTFQAWRQPGSSVTFDQVWQDLMAILRKFDLLKS